jgi:cell division protease FtsH
VVTIGKIVISFYYCLSFFYKNLPEKQEKCMSNYMKKLLVWLGVIVLLILLFNLSSEPEKIHRELSYNTFRSKLELGEIKKIMIEDRTVTGMIKEKEAFITILPAQSELINSIADTGVEVIVKKTAKVSWQAGSFLNILPMVILFGLMFFFMRRDQGGKKMTTIGKSKARLMEGQESKVTMDEVAGIEEAKSELAEIIFFLKQPEAFAPLGARIPKGVMLTGEPGTGKTLLAKAIAGEAGVPFFSISGSDFVEMYVGIGASRVRDLFKQAKKKAPCIIFIDEIDAVGRHRGTSQGGGSDEREQTLNQLLVEMDGFEVNIGIIIVAATNRPDILDAALMRPGRFDRQVHIPVPDVKGREQILKVHGKRTVLSYDVDLGVIAKGTPGFSGADLENMVNEAALSAVKTNAEHVNMQLLEQAKDKVMMGAERNSMIITEQEKMITACHEAGHALIAELLPESDPVHKVTIIPRGRALGLTMQLPVEEKYSQSKLYLESKMAVLLGGRVAEEILYGSITTGAGNDIERCTTLARRMVCEWGMSSMGPINFGVKDDGQGNTLPANRYFSETTALAIDKSVNKLIGNAHKTATKLLNDNLDKLKIMIAVLFEKETITSKDISQILSGQEHSRTTADG